MKQRPVYNLEQVKSLVSQGDYHLTQKVSNWLINHGFHPGDTVEEVFESLSPDGFHKADELNMRPGTYADIYFAKLDDEQWYVKFFIDEDGNCSVAVLSCRLDGFFA